MPRPSGALQRSLQAITVGVVKGVQQREEALARTELGDLTQHAQVAIDGRVGAKPYTFVMPVSWPIPFVYAPVQHDSDLENPHFNFGIELAQGSGLPVVSSAAAPTAHPVIFIAVAAWNGDDNGFATGADIAVTTWIPGATKKRKFAATAHLTFWGFGAPTDDDDDTEGDVS